MKRIAGAPVGVAPNGVPINGFGGRMLQNQIRINYQQEDTRPPEMMMINPGSIGQIKGPSNFFMIDESSNGPQN